MIHTQGGNEKLGGTDAAPRYSDRRQESSYDPLQGEDDSEKWEHDHWQEAVTHDRDDGACGDAGQTHQVQQTVYCQAANHTDTVDVAKMDLSRQK